MDDDQDQEMTETEQPVNITCSGGLTLRPAGAGNGE